MELFLPSILLMLLAGVVVFMILPRFGPYVLTGLSIALLIFGVSHHYKSFYDEYRLATWYQTSSFLAPALVLGIALFFLLSYMLTFFGGSGIPVPAMPSIPGVDDVTSAVTSAVNTAKSVVTNTVNTAKTAVSNTVGSVNRGLNNSLRFNNRKNNSGGLF